jgi:hypothetical protein
MFSRRKPSPEQAVAELRRGPVRRHGAFSRWRQVRLEQKLGRVEHGQLMRAYYSKR